MTDDLPEATVYLNGEPVPGIADVRIVGSAESPLPPLQDVSFDCSFDLAMTPEQAAAFDRAIARAARDWGKSNTFGTTLRRTLRMFKGKKWRALRVYLKRQLGSHERWTLEGIARLNPWLDPWRWV